MHLDLGIAAVLLLYTLVGWWRGFLSQVVGLLAVAAAWLVAPYASPHVARVLFASVPAPGLEVEGASILIAALLVIVSVYALVRLIPGSFVRHNDKLKRADRGIGAAFGGTRGVAMIYMILCAVTWLEPGIKRRMPKLNDQLVQSRVIHALRGNNALMLMRFDDLDALRTEIFAKHEGDEVTGRAKAVARHVVRQARRHHPASFSPPARPTSLRIKPAPVLSAPTRGTPPPEPAFVRSRQPGSGHIRP